MAAYIALIRKEAGSAFGVDFPDFPGCISSGATLDEALRGAREALTLHMKGMLQDGEEIPAPSTLDALIDDEHNRDAVPTFVVVPEAKGRAVRINITIDESLLEKLDEAAARQGFSRSGFLAEAIRTKLRRTG